MDFHTFLPLFLRTVTGFERQTGFFLLWPEEVMQRKKKALLFFLAPHHRDTKYSKLKSFLK